MINKNISVVTITKNDSSGLLNTLNSISSLKNKPFRVIVVNGSPENKKTINIINDFRNQLNLYAINEVDSGIYHAMNKGHELVNTKLVHYLNSGDIVFSEPYKNISEPVIMPALICNHSNEYKWKDKIKLNGYGYCHQGIIFPSIHQKYNTDLIYAADLDLIMRTFVNGLNNLHFNNSGGVIYYLDGFSSKNTKMSNYETLKCLKSRVSLFQYFKTYFYITIKSFLSRRIRRKLATILWS